MSFPVGVCLIAIRGPKPVDNFRTKAGPSHLTSPMFELRLQPETASSIKVLPIDTSLFNNTPQLHLLHAGCATAQSAPWSFLLTVFVRGPRGGGPSTTGETTHVLSLEPCLLSGGTTSVSSVGRNEPKEKTMQSARNSSYRNCPAGFLVVLCTFWIF